MYPFFVDELFWHFSVATFMNETLATAATDVHKLLLLLFRGKRFNKKINMRAAATVKGEK